MANSDSSYKVWNKVTQKHYPWVYQSIISFGCFSLCPQQISYIRFHEIIVPCCCILTSIRWGVSSATRVEVSRLKIAKKM